MSRQTRFKRFIPRSLRRLPRRSGRDPRTIHRRPLRHEPLEERRLLAVVTVDTLDDSIDFSDGLLSLREAIFATNTVPGPDTIKFDPALTASGPATILLTQGELAITDALMITGPGADLLTIDASGGDPNPATFGNGARIFNIDNHIDSAAPVALSGVTLTGGDPNGPGGAILSREQLSVDGVVFVGNHSRGGGAVAHSFGSATIANSTFLNNSVLASGHGGALLVENLLTGAKITVSSNHFSSNMAFQGGAIAVRTGGAASTLVLESSSITENSANAGGGISIDSASSLTATIRDSTISGNVSSGRGGGIMAVQTRELAIVDSVIANNTSAMGVRGSAAGGGAYFANSDVSVTGSTITGNAARAGGGLYSRMGELTISFSSIADNTAADGRGGGAVSYRSRFSILESTITGNSSAGTPFGGGGLWLSPAMGAAPFIANTLIEGNSAGGAGGGIEFRTGYEGPSSPSLTLTNVTIAHNAASSGGGIFTSAAAGGPTGPGLFLSGGAIIGNTATTSGGGIDSRLPNLTIQGTTISGNRARASGGGIALPTNISIPVQVSIIDAVLDGNVAAAIVGEGSAFGDGGALWVTSPLSTVSVINSSLTGNSARNGGAIFRRSGSPSGPLSIVASSITGNTAMVSGGGIYNERGPLSIDRSIVNGNLTQQGAGAGGHGGGVFNRMADVSINASSISSNSTAFRGGGLYHTQGDLSVTASTIAGNTAVVDGGGVHALTNSITDRILIHSSTVSGNSSQRAGGLYLRGDTTIRHSTIVANTGGVSGTGGVAAGDGSSRFELDHTIIAKNTQSVTEKAAPDIRFFLIMSNVTLRSSLIGDSTGTSLVEAPLGASDANGNLIGKSILSGGNGVIDPLLGPLANNGGPTLTHALLPGSPAIDGGALVMGVPLGFDQRGNPFSRMVNGAGDAVVRIDIGAYESQGVPHFSAGDFNRDGRVDACDYLIWRETVGGMAVPFAGADADGDGIIGEGDYIIWKANFGQGLILTSNAAGAGASLAYTVSTVEPQTSVAAPAPVVTPQPPALPGIIRAANSQPLTTSGRVLQIKDNLLAWWSTRPPVSDTKSDSRAGNTDHDSNEDDPTPTTAGLDLAFAALTD